MENIEAGREMDAAVAEKVMGLQENQSQWFRIPDYSTDIAAAWAVIAVGM
jgi:hypothetical protein